MKMTAWKKRYKIINQDSLPADLCQVLNYTTEDLEQLL